MTRPRSASSTDRVVEDFIQTLDTTTELVQSLLQDIREGEVDFATIKTELRILVDNVKSLASSIKATDSNLLELKIKMALLEKSVTELEVWMKTRKAENTALKAANASGKWQTRVAVISGLLALLTSSVTLLVHLVMK